MLESETRHATLSAFMLANAAIASHDGATSDYLVAQGWPFTPSISIHTMIGFTQNLFQGCVSPVHGSGFENHAVPFDLNTQFQYSRCGN